MAHTPFSRPTAPGCHHISAKPSSGSAFFTPAALDCRMPRPHRAHRRQKTPGKALKKSAHLVVALLGGRGAGAAAVGAPGAAARCALLRVQAGGGNAADGGRGARGAQRPLHRAHQLRPEDVVHAARHLRALGGSG